MQSKPSAKSRFRLAFLILIALVSILFFSLLTSSVRSSFHTLDELSGRRVSSLRSAVQTDLTNIASADSEMIASDEITFLALGPKDSERVVPEYYLRQTIKYGISYYGATIFYNALNDECNYVYGSSFASAYSSVYAHELMREISALATIMESAELKQWHLYEKDGSYFLYIVYRNRQIHLCSVVDIGAYMLNNPLPAESEDELTVIFSEDSYIFSSSSVTKEGLSPLPPIKGIISDEMSLSYKWFSKSIPLDIANLQIGILSPMRSFRESVFSQILPVIIISFVLFACLLATYAVYRSILIFPLQQITTILQKIDSGDILTTHDLKAQRYAEYDNINSSLTELVKRVQTLEVEKQAREHEGERALLQYYQLQTRSHFLLNCLKCLYSLIESNNNEKMKQMIIAVSNHLRYIFHDSISLVPLREELKEVDDYKSTVQFSQDHPIILIKEIPDEVLDCMVPPLIIQTFFENAIKYSNRASIDSLSFKIQAAKVEDNGTGFLQLRMSDNGVGYSAEVLERINSELPGYFEKENIGISNLRRRIAILFHDNYHCAFYNAPCGGATSIIFLPFSTERSD